METFTATLSIIAAPMVAFVYLALILMTWL